MPFPPFARAPRTGAVPVPDPIHPSGETEVRNWSGGVRFVPSSVVAPRSVDELQHVVRDTAQRGGHLRVIGAGHSFTPLVATDDVLVRLDHLTGLVDVDAATGEVTLWAGTRLRDVGPRLSLHGLALDSMGDIDSQTVAGAVATGTHGTGLTHTSYSGAVTGVQLVLPDGSVVWADAGERPDLFQAARVSLGVLGVVTQVRIRCVPAFNLAATETTEPSAAMLEGFLERSRAADHLEFYWFPGTPRVTVKDNRRMDASEATHPMTAVDRLVNRELLGNGAYELLCRAATRVPRLAGSVRDLASRAMAGGSFSDASYRVFVAPRRVRFTESEYAMPLDAFPDVLSEVERAIVASGQAGSFPMEVRTSAADDTWLGMGAGRESLFLAVHRYHREDVSALLRVVEPIVTAHGGRPHWGKRHTLDAARLAGLYPRFDDFRRVRAQVDPTGVMLNHHTRRLLHDPAD